MIAIAAVDNNWAIGCNNRLLLSIPDDMKFFRETTTGKTVIMGRKTLESFPGKRPLQNRTNIVLTRDESYEAEGVVTVHSKEELMRQIKDMPDDIVFVIGGESIYKMLVPLCSKCYITKMYATFPADSFFPNLDESEDWEVSKRGERRVFYDPESQDKEHDNLEYEFLTYTRKR